MGNLMDHLHGKSLDGQIQLLIPKKLLHGPFDLLAIQRYTLHSHGMQNKGQRREILFQHVHGIHS